MAGMEVSKIQVADIQPFTDSIKEIESNEVPVDENDSVTQSNVATDTINTTASKTTESNPDDIEFPE